MRAVPNWRRVLRHALSIRFSLLAGVLDGVSAALAIDPYLLPVPLMYVAIAAGVANCAALLSRFVAQRHLGDTR